MNTVGIAIRLFLHYIEFVKCFSIYDWVILRYLVGDTISQSGDMIIGALQIYRGIVTIQMYRGIVYN